MQVAQTRVAALRGAHLGPTDGIVAADTILLE